MESIDTKKGQGAAEYLVLLAIVLVVALIGIVLIGGMPSIGGEAQDTESKAYWGSVAGPFAISDVVQKGNTLYFSVSNKETERLVLRGVSVDNVSVDFGAGWVFKPQGTKNISISGLTMCNLSNYDSFAYGINFTYDSENIRNHSQIGVKKLVGRCSFS